MAAGAGGGDAGAAAAAAASTSGAPHAAATFATAATAVTRAGRLSSEEDFGAVGGRGHLTKLVLKFTTASESDVQPSCEVRYGRARSLVDFRPLALVAAVGCIDGCVAADLMLLPYV